MELKKEIEKSMSLPKRNHLIRRLDKARIWSSELSRIAVECCDVQGRLEAEAYATWLHGSMLLEKESDWTLALAKFTRARSVWSLSTGNSPQGVKA